MSTERKAGRPKMDELEKLRREAYKTHLSMENFTKLAETEKKLNLIEEQTTGRQGRKPKTAEQRADDARRKFLNLLISIRKIESERGIEHKNVLELYDDSIKSLAGKPKGDEIDELDYKLLTINRQIAKLQALPDEPEQQKMGRKRISTVQKIRQLKIEKAIIEARIGDFEENLVGIEIDNRKLKKARTALRLAKKDLKNGSEVDSFALNAKVKAAEKEVSRLNTIVTCMQKIEDLRAEANRIEELLKNESDDIAIKLLKKKATKISNENVKLVAMIQAV